MRLHKLCTTANWSTSTRLIYARVALTALASTFPIAAEQHPADVFLQWSLVLDSGGQIVSLTSLSIGASRQLARQLESTIRHWHFAPGNINGQPAETDTTLTVRVALDDTGTSNYRVRVVSAMTGARYQNGPVPTY